MLCTCICKTFPIPQMCLYGYEVTSPMRNFRVFNIHLLWMYIFEHYKHLQYYSHVAYHFQTAQFSLIMINSGSKTSSLYYHGYWLEGWLLYTQHTNYYYHNEITRHDFFVLFETFHSLLSFLEYFMVGNFHK